MSLPSFEDGSSSAPVSDTVNLGILPSSGSGNRLPIWLLALCGSFTVVGEFNLGLLATPPNQTLAKTRAIVRPCQRADG
jgi:hypothetical protein